MINIRRMPAALWVLRVLLLALVYVLAGRLSLLLAISPGYVTGLFLPMGIALGAVLIWGNSMGVGVFLGSLLLNISVSDASDPGWSAFLLATGIACGSLLASLAGSALIRRYVGFPNSLTDERKIFAFFLLGGPIATGLSAGVRVLVLILNDAIPGGQALYHWWTWWVGDVMGVLIATPLVLVLFAEPRRFWRGRRVTVGVPLVVSCLLVVAIFVMSSKNEQKKIDDQFRQQAQLISASVSTSASTVIHTLATLRGLFAASEDVTRDEFSAFINDILTDKRGVSVFSWNLPVKHADRLRFENTMSEELAETFHINEKDIHGNFIVAPERNEYTVITYIEPHQGTVPVLGFNLDSDPMRREALSLAHDSGGFAMTRPLYLLQDGPQKTPGIVLYFPVYDTMQRLLTAAERREHIRGYVAAIVRTNDLVNSALLSFPSADFHLEITDITWPEETPVFYRKSDHQPSFYAQSLRYEKRIQLGGRTLLATVTPTERFLAGQVSLQSWFVLGGGLLFCCLVGGFLLLISGRTQHITNLVEKRSKELAAVWENAVESILIVDESGHIEKANQAAAKLFQYPLEYFPELHIADLIPLLREAFISSSLQTMKTEIREALGRCSSGKDLAIELSVSPVEIQDHKFFTFIIHDVTERRKVEKLKSEFISTVSHELRTPLTSIKGALGIVTSGNAGELPPNVKNLLDIANSNAERLSGLVNDILDIEKLEFGKVQLKLKPQAIYPLLQQSLEQNSGYGTRYGVRLQLDSPTEAAMSANVNLDSNRFLQVMANLISNAVKFSYLDGLVRVTLEIDQKMVKVSVIDEGAGVPDEFRSQIFQKFAQVDASDTRWRDGTGLGLSITKVIVERMGGKIDYHSRLGAGSTFYFTLPLHPG